MRRKDQKRRSEIIRILSDMSHSGWRGDYASLEAELGRLEART